MTLLYFDTPLPKYKLCYASFVKSIFNLYCYFGLQMYHKSFVSENVFLALLVFLILNTNIKLS